ncbi:MAG: hypothetical protein OEP45_01010, partial [Acidobacteriota bacterium]|nr:hypothetical protein [Acidobacteriota bacterium]
MAERARELRVERELAAVETESAGSRPVGRSIRIEDDTVTTLAPETEQEGQEESQEEIPFYRKFIAKSRPDDPGGYGPNWSNVDDFDIPTVLRKQMD